MIAVSAAVLVVLELLVDRALDIGPIVRTGWAVALAVQAVVVGDPKLGVGSMALHAALGLCAAYHLRAIDAAVRGGDRAASSHWLDVFGASSLALAGSLSLPALLDFISSRGLTGWNVPAPVFASSSGALDPFRSDLAAVPVFASIALRTALSALAFAGVALAGPTGVMAIVAAQMSLFGAGAVGPIAMVARAVTAAVSVWVAWSAYASRQSAATDGHTNGYSRVAADVKPRDPAHSTSSLTASAARSAGILRVTALMLGLAAVRWLWTPGSLDLSAVGASGPDQWIVIGSVRRRSCCRR